MWRLAQFIERWKEYVVLFLLTVIAFALMSLNSVLQLQQLRRLVISSVAGVQQLIGAIPNPLRLERENQALHQISLQLTQQVLRSQQALMENQQLRGLLQLQHTNPYPLRFAQVVGKIGQPGNLFLILNAGAQDSVKPDMCVLSAHGIIGHIVEVTDRFSVVRSLLHRQTRIAAMLEQSQRHGILQWNDQWGLHLAYISQSYPVEIGERVLTSPFSTRYPPYLPIGIVQNVIDSPSQLDHRIFVEPLSPPEQSQWVGIILSVPSPELQALLHQYQQSIP